MTATKNRLLILLCFLSLPAWMGAQIIHEHTYTGTAYLTGLHNSGYKYYVLDSSIDKLRLYNLDHSLWKTVNLQVPSGYELYTAQNVSEMLFTLDGQVGFTYSYYTTDPNYQYNTRVITENGTVLLTITDAVSAYAYNAGEAGAKLLAFCTDYNTNTTTTQVFDLPGEIWSGESSLSGDFSYAYPVPSAGRVCIPYQLPGGVNEAIIRIHDMEGREVARYTVDRTFTELIIEPGTFQKGLYFYAVVSGNQNLGSGKFIVQ
jgi:hypothetical protein